MSGERERPDAGAAALLSTVGMAAQGLGRFAYLAAIGRTMPGDVFADVSALLSVAVLLSLAWPVPLGNAASRWMSVDADAGTQASLNRSGAMGSLAIGALSVPLALALGVDLATALGTGAVAVAYGGYVYARGARLGLGGARLVCAMDLASAVLSLTLLAIVLIGDVRSALLLPIATGYLLFALVVAPHRWRRPGSFPAGLRSFAAWNVLGGFATNGLLLVAMVVANAATGAAEAAAYAAAYSLATPASMLGQAVSQVLIAAGASRADDAAGRRRLRIEVAAICVTVSVAFALAAALAPVYMPWFYPGLEGAVASLQLLLVAVWLFTLGLIPAALLLAQQRSRAVALGSIAGCVLGFASMVALAGPLGTVGVTAGFGIGSLVTLASLVAVAVHVRQTSRRPIAQ
ncbi:hypothetical protein [Agrococcus sp. TF02-05]|uniref:hypothetical protein n=1 Tax=Agrococcus sp. TF02-05 TaxID=2815211 RepID=UPI001AA1007E|nr:hypothetical protein [Agrococcus sp. TF02-05]MBO1770702.1 hypothetical protein [Agrococcus sp. TF02-05]